MVSPTLQLPLQFQHTAARRRLVKFAILISYPSSFNTQPPEGGCAYNFAIVYSKKFQHTAA